MGCSMISIAEIVIFSVKRLPCLRRKDKSKKGGGQAVKFRVEQYN